MLMQRADRTSGGIRADPNLAGSTPFHVQP